MTQADDLDCRAVLAAYPADCQPASSEYLAGAGGFSGARFWRLQTPRGPLCLRRWPAEHPTPARLEFIQAVLRHVGKQGFSLVPVPLDTNKGRGYIRHAGHLWELAPWMPGAANYQVRPSPAKLESALAALAGFHQAAATFPLPAAPSGPSPGVAERLARLQRWLGGELRELRTAVFRQPTVWQAAAGQLCELFPRAAPTVLAELQRAARLDVPLQPCLRDIWRDHVLFSGDKVTGITDFGALRAENVAGDVARLLGSLAEDNAADWETGLAAYQRVRPLSAEELALASALDQSGVLLGGMNWLSWIYLEGRTFENAAAVNQRLQTNLRRLTCLAATLASPAK